jgi:hypothetical protein
MRKLLWIFLLLGFLPAERVLAQEAPSVARLWNERTLAAIRLDFARPTVHARTLFHVSVAMYDAWAAYDEVASTVLFSESPISADPALDREIAVSFAAYGVLRARFAGSPNGATTLVALENQMIALGHDPTNQILDGDSPEAIGNRIAARVLAFGRTDGANETEDYANRWYVPVNPPLLPGLPGNPDLVNWNQWQPLALVFFVDQSGNTIIGGSPDFLSPEWGDVVPFGLSPVDRTLRQRAGHTWTVWMDPGAPPLMGSDREDEYRRNFEMVLAWSKHLSPDNEAIWDISPAGIGAALLPDSSEDWEDFYDFTEGGDRSMGYPANPVSGEIYPPQLVDRGDYVRVLAEFWADGPDSETPPGHWFHIWNQVMDHPQFERRMSGAGSEMEPLEWETKSYLLLGGAMHDAAIAAWSLKGFYDFIRPISVIRAMAGRGQSSDPAQASYHPDGLRLIPELIEMVTYETTRPRKKHRHLRGNEGKVAVYAWRGPDAINNPLRDTAGVGWILAEEWWPYQRPSFVTPFFAGYVSGHSTFSRAAANVLHQITGSPYFPGGLAEFTAQKNEFLVFEDGPSETIHLQWASYYDAANQCSLSRIWGGIHPPADDLPGRKIGDQVAQGAWNRARQYWTGAVPGLSIGLSELPTAQEDLFYEVDLGISGGTTPYQCRLISGDLPEGLVLTADGRIRGTPERRRRSATIVIGVEDALGVPAERSYEIESVKAMNVGARRFRRGREGKKYKMRLRPKRGVPPYTISIVEGFLPDGLLINGAKYRLEGIPSESGFFPLTLEIRDSSGAKRTLQDELFIRPAN